MAARQEQEPASTEVAEVAPDILRFQLPISMPGLGHVNTYALCDDRGVALVDPGLPGKASWNALVDRLDRAGYRMEHVHSVIVTHSHPDHFGGAGLIRDRTGAEVVTHESFRTWLDPVEGDDVGPDDLAATSDPDASDTSSESDGGEGGVGAPNGAGGRTTPWSVEQPWGGGTFKPPMKRRLMYRAMRTIGKRWMRAPDPSRRLTDGDVTTFAGREWVALHTPGHTHDHLCLFSPADGVVLSGDHVLPTITPHISGLAAGSDPLAAFFASLDRMTTLDGAGLVLPAHGHPFDDLTGRVNDIKEHHDARLQKLRDAVASEGEASVHELMKHLFKERSWGSMAESETYAHLEHLRFAGELQSRRIDDRLHYAFVPEPAES